MTTVSRSKRAVFSMMLAASFGLSPLTLCLAADNPAGTPAPSNMERSEPLMCPAGFKAKTSSDDSAIKSSLASLTDRAVTKGDFNSLLGLLATQDKEQARQYKDVDQAKLDGIIEQIRQAWKSKYSEDFGIGNKDMVFGNHFTIAEFEVTQPEVAVANWPVPPVSGEARMAADRSNAEDMKKEAKNAELTSGRDVALVRFPSNENLPPLIVSMVDEVPMMWRVDVPNNRTGEQIYNDLVDRLTAIRDHQDKWPSNEAAAYRLVARNVVEALYGLPLPQHEHRT